MKYVPETISSYWYGCIAVPADKKQESIIEMAAKAAAPLFKADMPSPLARCIVEHRNVDVLLAKTRPDGLRMQAPAAKRMKRLSLLIEYPSKEVLQ